MSIKCAELRVCMSCEWIFKYDEKTKMEGCPKCGMGHYGARFAYGQKAYTYTKTQFPWKERKLAKYSVELEQEIQESRHE